MKQPLYQHLLTLISDKLNLIEKAFEEQREALLSESKSTAGDKHETGRAMIQLEQEKLSSQLLQLQKQRDMLLRVNPEKECSTVQMGALVETDIGIYFISIGLGQVSFDEKMVFSIAPASPVAQLMLGRKVGESFSFNEKIQTIEAIS